MGVEDLLEKVLLEAEMLDLKANPDRNATGSICLLYTSEQVLADSLAKINHKVQVINE